MNLVSPELAALQSRLIALAQRWALREPVDLDHAAQLRAEALALLHRHYLARIPAYARLAAQEGVGQRADPALLKARLMSTDDLFKSYRPRWLDEGDFASMTAWLGELHHRPIRVDAAGFASLDQWLERLRAGGLRPVLSSGTSGALSFVPRDEANLALTRRANTAILLPLLLYDRLGEPWQRALAGPAARLLGPAAFERAARRLAPRGFEAVLLDFRGGRTGMQAIAAELAPAFGRSHFLYPLELTAADLRRLGRPPRGEADLALLARLQRETVARRDEHLARLAAAMAAAARAGRRVFIFGAPFQLKDLCAHLRGAGRPLELAPGSAVLFGGGWKSFAGEAIPREELEGALSLWLGLPPERIIEGYSMTELNVMLVRCRHGRFHIPPSLEPALFDEALEPVEVAPGAPRHGLFGFLDPLAFSYPGFIITGDQVTWLDAPCPCGLTGPALTAIARAGGREAKGCAGVLASVQA